MYSCSQYSVIILLCPQDCHECSLFIFGISNFCPLSLSLSQPGLAVYQFLNFSNLSISLNFSKNQVLVLLFLSANILFSTSLISAAILIIYLFFFVNFGLIFLFSFCHGSLSTVWKRISRHSIAEGSELIKSKEQDKEGTESSED